MSLDISTLYIVAALVGVMLGGMLLFFGRQQKIPALNWWGAAYILGAISIGVWTLTNSLLIEGLALAFNAVGFVACGMVWSAARVFHGRKPNWVGLPLGAIVWLVVIMCPPDETSAMRLTIGAGIVAAYAGLMDHLAIAA